MAAAGADRAAERRSPSPLDDEFNTLIKLLTVVGVAIGIQQLVSPYVSTVMAFVIAISATALFGLVSLVGIRIMRRWRDQVSLRVWVIVVCVVAVGVVGVLTGLVLAYVVDGGATLWAGLW
jgi:ABC-type Na+ efflux pump permease subunit